MNGVQLPLVLLDSIAASSEATRGAFVVSGSHGGVSAARFALTYPPTIVAFNDAGVGLDAAGIAGLSELDAIGVAAFTVAHTTARIGDAASTLATGVITHVNLAAITKGIRVGDTCKAIVLRFCGLARE